jgi:Ser/Thr protein kinase RdoA (MazF antagonist)
MTPDANGALKLWAIDAAEVHLAAHRENHVFKVTAKNGAAFALRMHRPGYRSRDEINSELAWMTQLAQEGVAVPLPLVSRAGNLVEQHNGDLVDVLTWLPGLPLGKNHVPLAIENRSDVFRNIGKELARLHLVSDRWNVPQPFNRPRLGIDGLLGENPVWGRFWENPSLTADQVTLLTSTRQKAIEVLKQNLDALDQGLIHADLARENILVTGKDVAFIDFDDSGHGFRAYDIAVALFRNRTEPDYPQLRAGLIEGYQSLRPLNLDLLDLFILLRAMSFVGWIVPRAADLADGEARNQRFIAEAIALAASMNLQ